MIESSIVLDSINPHGSRLVTMLSRYPKFIHAEHCRHRAFSFSVSSSRAIPVSKNLEEVRSDELRAAPVWWGKEQKGMRAAEELSDEKVTNVPERYKRVFGDDPYYNWQNDLSDREYATIAWRQAAKDAMKNANILIRIGVHKSIVNRILEPFLHVNVLTTGTTDGWMNFFGLRLDKAAQPEIRVLAEAQWRCWNESTPQKLEPGQWHLPFIDGGASGIAYDDPLRDAETNRMIKVSVARCARLSYLSFETGKRSTIEEDLALYDRLITSRPIHASPAEHQATPDEHDPVIGNRASVAIWLHHDEAGNLGPGWRQYRKMLPGERVAELPEAYR